MTAAAGSLGGLGVLVTRPARQAESLRAALAAVGGHAIDLPLLDIVGPGDAAAATAALRAARGDRWWLFSSPNAARWAARLSPSATGAWPNRLAAAGSGTAAALEALGQTNIHVPAQDGAAGLLELAELDRAARQPDPVHVTIVCGENSPPWLADGLRRKGFSTRIVPVYRRLRVHHSPAELEAALRAADAAILTSGSALEQLWALTPDALHPRLQLLQLAVPSARVVEMARHFSFSCPPLVPQHVSDAEFVHSLVQWHQNREIRACR